MPVASILSSITELLTDTVGDYGLYAIFFLMLVDAVFPAASEPVMVYGGAVAAGAFAGQDIVFFGRELEPGFPAFYRVVWNEHVREFSDLSAADRIECMDAVVAVESLLREHLRPTKVNIAALGNAVPHLHWHVIARFDWDSHFPGSVWAQAQRELSSQGLQQVLAARTALEQALSARLG